MTKPTKPNDRIDMSKLRSPACEAARDTLGQVETAYQKVLDAAALGSVQPGQARMAAQVLDDHHKKVEDSCGAPAAKLPPRPARPASGPKP